MDAMERQGPSRTHCIHRRWRRSLDRKAPCRGKTRVHRELRVADSRPAVRRRPWREAERRAEAEEKREGAPRVLFLREGWLQPPVAI